MLLRISLLLFSILFISAQTPLLTINDKVVGLEEFERTQKTNLEQLGVQKSLALFAEFELLAQYALDQGAEKSNLFLLPYQKSLAKLRDENIIDPAILNPALEEYFQKIINEYEIQVLYANNKDVSNIQKLVKKKGDFTKLIEQYSVSSKYIEPHWTEYYKIDDALLSTLKNLPVNSVSQPITYNDSVSIFIKKTNQRPNLGLVRIQQYGHSDKKTAEEVLRKVKNGEDFTGLIKSSSQISKGNKGVLPDVITSIPTEIYQAVKGLEVGEYSSVFPYNDKFYVVRLLRHVPLNTIEQKRDIVLPVFIATEKYQKLMDQNIRNVDTVSAFHLYPKNINELIEKGPNWYQGKSNFTSYNKPLYRLGNYTLTQSDLLKRIHDAKADSISSPILETLLGEDIREMKKNYYENVLFFQQPKMRPAIDSIKKATLIDFAFDELILKNSYSDIEGMQAYIQEHPEKFTLPERAQLTIYNCVNDKVAKQVKAQLEKGESAEEIQKAFQTKLDSQNQPFVYLQQGKVSQQSSEFPKGVEFKPGITIIPGEKGHYLVCDIKEIVPSQLMTVEEARKELFEEYQTIYYKKTIEDLKKKSKIEYNPQAVNELKKRYKE